MLIVIVNCNYVQLPSQTTSGQSNLAKAALNPLPLTMGMGTPSNTFRVPRSLHPKQDLDPFSHF